MIRWFEQVYLPESDLSSDLRTSPEAARARGWTDHIIPSNLLTRRLLTPIFAKCLLKFHISDDEEDKNSEIMRGKSSKQLSLDHEKLLTKEKLLILESMKRRGVAMACVDIISWEVHERYLQKLFSHLRLDPLENFMKVTIQQVMRADRQVFMFMIKEDVSLRRLLDNTFQVDTMIMEALRSYEVSFHLVPLPRPKTAAPLVKTIKDGGAWNIDQEHWTPAVAPYGKGKGKGKKGKGKKQIDVLPKALQHKDNVSQGDHGGRLCFNFNLGKCDQAAHGAHCKNGYHLCCRKGCFARHPVSEHQDGKKN